jgi:small subunit ribosomal protein S16
MDIRQPRDGRVIEELGFYDPMIKETDARATLNGERIDYWLSVGAKPSENVRVLIKKYGTNGSRLEQQKEALEQVKLRPQAPAPVVIPKPVKATHKQAPAPSEAATDESSGQDAAAQASDELS